MSTLPVVGSTPTVVRLIGVAGPPLILAIAGVTHPPQLTPSTADHWTHLHLVLLPVFPLLALGPWLLAVGHPRLRVATALLGYVYAVFYSALDVLAGIGTGTLVAGASRRRRRPCSPSVTSSPTSGWARTCCPSSRCPSLASATTASWPSWALS